MKTVTKIMYLAFAPLVIACLALSPMLHGQLSPPPDGGYANQNTAEGENALFSLAPNGVRNTAIGFNALFSNTGGGANTAIGAAALANNTANDNTACGSYAMTNNTTGSGNTAFGIDALMLNINGNSNHASGHDALFNNVNGSNNTANGANALFNNTAASGNTANGASALFKNTTGSGNTASGFAALFNNTTGNHNTAEGDEALLRNTSGSNNIALSYTAGVNLTTGSNNIDIGGSGLAGESNTIRIGSPQTRTFIKGISGAVVTGAAVVVNASGQLGVAPSSARFKDKIRAMDKESEAILALKPVSFCYDQDIDAQSLTQFGLVAEDVEKVNPDLVIRDDKGKPFSVRYDQVNAMLLNEFLKEHSTVQELKATVAQQQRQIDALTAGLQKVSAQLELQKQPARTLVNNQ